MNGMDFDLLEKIANRRVHLRSPGRRLQTIARICDLLAEDCKPSRAFAISWQKIANHRVRLRSNATRLKEGALIDTWLFHAPLRDEGRAKSRALSTIHL